MSARIIRHLTRTLLCAIGLVAGTALLGAQQASISGVILNEVDSRPISHAIVTINGATLKPTLTTIADAQGRFSFPGLPAGQFTLTASKATFLSMAYGQALPGRGSGLPVSLRDGQQVANLTWKLPPGAVISGTVIDETGRPLPEIPIVLMQYRTLNDQRTLNAVTCCVWPVSGPTGEYRVTGITPGEYLVSAIPAGAYVFMPSGPFPGSSQEVREITTAEMQWALGQIAGTSTAARPATPSTATVAPAQGRPLSYGRVYYPGTIDEQAATAVTLRAGEERRDINFTMRLERTARIEGRIVLPDGQPATNARITMGGATTGATGGNFSYRNQLPGRYPIVARTPTGLWGSIDVTLNGQDMLDQILQLGPGVTIAGKVTFDSASGAQVPDPTRVRITSRPLSPGALQVTALADGAFSMPSLDPGRYRLSASLAPPPAASAGQAPSPAPAATTFSAAPGGTVWTLKSVMLNGRDIADSPIDLKPGDAITGVVVTFSDRVAELSGTLFDAAGQPAPGYYVVVFSTDTALWSQGSRRVPAPARASTDGKFRFAGLPPGSYYLIAATSADANDLADPAYLKQLAASAITVTIGEGEKKVQDLRFK